MALWFGELNNAQPNPWIARGMMIRNTEESSPTVEMRNCAMAISAQPMVQSRRDPKRSDSQPATGAMAGPELMAWIGACATAAASIIPPPEVTISTRPPNPAARIRLVSPCM